MKYLINSPLIDNLDKKYVNETINGGWLSSNGKNTKIFEKKISNYLKLKHALAVQSGTAALHLALKSFGCKQGDNIILPNHLSVIYEELSSGTDIVAAIPKLKEVTKELERQRDILTRHNETAKSYQQAQIAIKSLSADIVNIEEKISKVEELEKMENLDNNPEITSLKEELSDIKTVLKEFITQSTENHSKLSSHLEAQLNSTKAQQTVYNNCNNQNNMTINVFLNEQCKDALNLTDFVQNIKVTLEDLQYTKDNGFVDGVTNIITKQLQDLKPTERPIHCSDKKRLQFYVKDDDKWEKDEI